jgi:hypothetical protein
MAKVKRKPTEPTMNTYAKKVKGSRKGTRKNSDKSESTVLMTYAEADGKYYAYPTLFQNKDGSWEEFSDEDENGNKTWAAMNEAFKRGETYAFPSEEQASNFAAGAWKDVERLPLKPVKSVYSSMLKANR